VGPEFICLGYDRSIIWQRWAALWLDIIVRATIICLMIFLADDNYLPLSISLAVLFFILYYPILEGLTGQTFGKWVCRMRVVDANGNIPGIPRAIIRTLLRLIEINPFLFGGIPAGIAVASSTKRQRLGDMAANTFVVRCADLDTQPALAEPWRSPYDMGPQIESPPPVPRMKSFGLKAWALLLIIPGASLLYSGIQGKKSHSAFLQPIALSCSQFLNAPVREGWYHLSGCSLDLSQAIYEFSQTTSYTGEAEKKTNAEGPITIVHIPVFGDTDREKEKAGLVISTQDERYKSVVDELRQMGDKKKSEIKEWATKNQDRVFVDRDFVGTVKVADSFGDISSASMEASDQFKVKPKFGILTEGDAPRRGDPNAAITLGAIFTLLAALFWVGPWRREERAFPQDLWDKKR